MRLLAAILVCLFLVASDARPKSRKGKGVTEQVFRALQRAVKFFEDDYKDLNLDGLYGLRVAQGQLIDVVHGVTSGKLDLPSDIKEKLIYLITRMERISQSVISNLKDTVYYDKFKYVVARPFSADYNPARSVDNVDMDTSPLQIVDDIHNYNEEFGDKCFEELIGADIPGRETKKCTILPKCADYLLKGKDVFGYRLTHQLLFLIFGQMFKCTDNQEYLMRKPYEEKITNVCSKVFMEAMILLNMGAAETSYRDFFLEEVATCGMLGFQDFFRRDWLKKILSWQTKKGCFTNVPDDALKKKSSPMRRLLVDKKMNGDCLSHESGLGASVLGTYLRHLLENNGKFRD
ncbi:UPF0764 protein C16orf89 homolog [Lineus longissimus]|uniref:UPF0764 protein C16orf89 homolog n=1 Tax=Lineus longissimus TaxID=88925 RepID=UPI002B4DF18E